MATKEQRERYRQKKIAEWVAANGVPPPCECGCGEPVKFNASGKPNRFAGPEHVSRSPEFRELQGKRMRIAHEDRRERQDAVPIEKFRFSVRAVKDAKQLSFPQMAEMGGWGLGTLNYYMYDDRVKSLGRDTAENFFRRIVGAPAPPTARMLKQISKSMLKERRFDKYYNL